MLINVCLEGFSSEAELFAWIEKTDIGVFSVKFGGIVFSPETEGTDKFPDNLTVSLLFFVNPVEYMTWR